MTEAGLFERESTGDSGSCEPEIHNPVAPGYGPTSGLLDGRAALARNQEQPAETSAPDCASLSTVSSKARSLRHRSNQERCAFAKRRTFSSTLQNCRAGSPSDLLLSMVLNSRLLEALRQKLTNHLERTSKETFSRHP